MTSRKQTKEPRMTQIESGLHHADVPASGPNVNAAIEKTDAIVSGDVEALGEEARAIDAQLHARVLRKIDLVLMPAMVIGMFTPFDYILFLF